MNIFNYDNLVMTWLRKILDMISISVMWILFCIPVFTIGASTSALYYSIQKNLKHNRGYAATEFFHAFKANFKQATQAWLIMFLVAVIFLSDYWILGGISESHIILRNMQALFVVLLALEVVYMFLVFPYIARFSNTIKNTFKNSAILAVKHLPSTIFTAFILTLGILVVYAVPVLAVIVPALVTWQISYILEKIYRKYITNEEREAEAFRNKQKSDEQHKKLEMSKTPKQ